MVRADERPASPGSRATQTAGPKAQGTSRMVNVWQHDEREVLPVTSDKKSRCRLHGSAKGGGGSSSERNGQYVTASGRDCGAAENQRITENAPPWSDIIPKFEKCIVCAALLDMAVEPVVCAILVWLEAL